MNFRDKLHEQAFNNFLSHAQVQPEEGHYRAALYVLSGPLLAKKVENYIRPRKILFQELAEAAKSWGGDEKVLVLLAGNLFNGCFSADVNEIFRNLDQENVELALEAIRARFL